MAHAFVLAASSTLGQALCRQLAANGFALTITGRNLETLQELATDLQARSSAKVTALVADMEAPDYDPAVLLAQAETAQGPITHLFTLPGVLGTDIAKITRVNYTAVAQLIDLTWPTMKERGAGTIVVVSSIAGDRGRGSNYIYGAAKAALSTYTNGLRHHLRETKLHVMTVKPGFIDSPMTFGQGLPLVASPDSVARSIMRAMDRGRTMLYVPWFWWGIMLIIRNLPEFIFRKLPL